MLTAMAAIPRGLRHSAGWIDVNDLNVFSYWSGAQHLGRRRLAFFSDFSDRSGAPVGFDRFTFPRNVNDRLIDEGGRKPIASTSATWSGSMSIRPLTPSCFRVDEKSQIQALDRTQPGLPMKPGRAGTMTHDYKRHGTTTLFAALNILDGTVIGRNMQRHRHQEFIRFLNTDRGASSGGKSDPCRRRQLCHPQTPEGAPMAGPPPALDLPLHPDLGVLAQRR